MSEHIVGIDAHKYSHTLVVVDAVGRKLGEKTVATTTKAHRGAIDWVRRNYGSSLRWAVEDCRSMTARLERDLLAADEHVIRVPPHLMSRVRASARTPGKSDPIDALSVARAVLRYPDLPVACHDETSWHLKQLVDRRDDLVAQRRATITRILERIHRLDPTFDKPANWDVVSARERVARTLDIHCRDDPLTVGLAQAELDDINRLTADTKALSEQLAGIVEDAAPALLAIRGCAALTAAKIVGETAGVHRFKSEAAFARYVGVAPIPHMSGTADGLMLPAKMGNRQLNAALHRIAVSQIRLRDSRGHAYHRMRLDGGDTRGRALRALKRRLARVVYQALRADAEHPRIDGS